MGKKYISYCNEKIYFSFLKVWVSGAGLIRWTHRKLFIIITLGNHEGISSLGISSFYSFALSFSTCSLHFMNQDSCSSSSHYMFIPASRKEKRGSEEGCTPPLQPLPFISHLLELNAHSQLQWRLRNVIFTPVMCLVKYRSFFTIDEGGNGNWRTQLAICHSSFEI